MGRLKTSDAIPVGTGVGALYMAEQFTFQKTFIEGRTVDIDKRFILSGNLFHARPGPQAPFLYHCPPVSSPVFVSLQHAQ